MSTVCLCACAEHFSIPHVGPEFDDVMWGELPLAAAERIIGEGRRHAIQWKQWKQVRYDYDDDYMSL